MLTAWVVPNQETEGQTWDSEPTHGGGAEGPGKWASLPALGANAARAALDLTVYV
jgi:hypothetical protein